MRVIRRNTTIADHIVVHGYGHWFANDLRGSGSSEVREAKLIDLGEIHRGRKVVHPSKEELKAF